jgi:hypothetical protein
VPVKFNSSMGFKEVPYPLPFGLKAQSSSVISIAEAEPKIKKLPTAAHKTNDKNFFI